MSQKLFLLFLLITISMFAGKISAAPCSTDSFTDADKRDFADKKPFKFDVDGDGKTDTITPRTFNTKGTGKVRENHWITFDLKTSRGKTINSFFKFRYGDNLADYWIYLLIPCKIGGSRQNDLLFYTGDDGGGEIVVLQNRGNWFEVISREKETN